MPKVQRWIIVKKVSFADVNGRKIGAYDYFTGSRKLWRPLSSSAKEYKNRETAERIAFNLTVRSPEHTGSVFVKSRVRDLETR